MQVKTLAFASKPQQSGLCCVFRAQTLLNLLGASVIALRICDGSTRKGKALRVHTAVLHCTPQRLRDVAVTERQHAFSQVTSPSSSTHSMNRRDVLNEKRSSHADSSGRKCLKKDNEHFTEAHQELDCWFCLAANALLRPKCFGASRIEMYTGATVSKKGEGQREHTKQFASTGGVTRWRRQHCTQLPCRLGGGSGLRSVFPDILLEASSLWSTWKNTTRGCALPTLERKVVDDATVSRC